MGKWPKRVLYQPVESVYCDFCARSMKPVQFGQRTCVRCSVLGWPDQSATTWDSYMDALLAKLRDEGRRRLVPKKAKTETATP